MIELDLPGATAEVRPKAPAGPPSREELAAEDARAAAALVAVQRLAHGSTLYVTENEAQRRQLEQTRATLRELAGEAGRRVTFLFSDRAVYVCGRLLRASRAVYTAAAQLERLLAILNATELSFGADVSLDELRALQGIFRDALREKRAPTASSTLANVRWRMAKVASAALDLSKLDPDEQALRGYCIAVVVMRRFLAQLQEGSPELSAHVRRVAHQLVALTGGPARGTLVAAVTRAAHDDADRTVQAALVALWMARQLTDDGRLLARLALATMLCDVGIPRVAAVPKEDRVRGGLRLPSLGLEQYRELPAATAVVTTMLGKLTDAGAIHSVLVYEALHLRYRQELGPPYGGARPVSLAARLIAAARRFAELQSDPESGEERTVETTLATLHAEMRGDDDAPLLRLLFTGLGCLPHDTRVELSTGEIGEVVSVRGRSGAYGRPVVRLIVDADGMFATDKLLDLRRPPTGHAPAHIAKLLAMPQQTVVREAAPLQGEPVLHLPGLPSGMAADTAPASERATLKPRRGTKASLLNFPAPTRLPAASEPTEPAAPGRFRPKAAAPASPAPEPPSELPLVTTAPAPGTPKPEPPSSPGLEPPSELPLVTAAPAPARPPRPEPPAELPLVTAAPAPARPPRPEPPAELPLVTAEPLFADAFAPGSADELEIEEVAPGPPPPPARRPLPPPRRPAAPPAAAPAMPPPTKRGNVRKTPLVHLLAHALDHRLTGSMLLGPASAVPPVGIYLHEGAPDRLVIPDSVPVDRQNARRRHAEEIRHLFGLPADTPWAYYANLDLWPDREPFEMGYEALSWIVLGVRLHTTDETIDRLLDRLGREPLTVHAEADARRFGFNAREQPVLERMRQAPTSLPELLASGAGTPKEIRTVVYALLVTRYAYVGAPSKAPIGLPPAAR